MSFVVTLLKIEDHPSRCHDTYNAAYLPNAHFGIVRMKAARPTFDVIWQRPGIFFDIDKPSTRAIVADNSVRHLPITPLQPCSSPDRHCSRVHIDNEVPFVGKMILVGIDTHSMCIEAETTYGFASAITLNKLGRCSSRVEFQTQ